MVDRTLRIHGPQGACVRPYPWRLNFIAAGTRKNQRIRGFSEMFPWVFVGPSGFLVVRFYRSKSAFRQ
jgi:hypothetical protein